MDRTKLLVYLIRRAEQAVKMQFLTNPGIYARD